jgi:hypothetical protein
MPITCTAEANTIPEVEAKAEAKAQEGEIRELYYSESE